MKADTLLKKVTATLGGAVLTIALGACASHRAVDTTAQTTGQVRTEQAAQDQAVHNDQVLGTAPAPSNAQGVQTPSTPAVISGPAAVDKSGNVYTSSSVGAAGNGSATGLNTNVNIRSQRPASNVVVTQSPATTVETTPAPTVVETMPAPTVVETPAPAPVIVETPAPAPAPVVTETQTTTETTPMASAQTTTTETQTTTTTTKTKHHRRMRKD